MYMQAEDIDLPLKQNQTVIIKYFNLSRDKFCDDFLGKEKKKEQKRYIYITVAIMDVQVTTQYNEVTWLLMLNVISHRESLLLHAEDSDHDLQVLLKVINLLAACCEGENLFIESLCQNIMSIDELMTVKSLLLCI